MRIRHSNVMKSNLRKDKKGSCVIVMNQFLIAAKVLLWLIWCLVRIYDGNKSRTKKK